MNKRILLFAILAAILLFGCSPAMPPGIISEKDMEDILVDYHLAQGMAETADKPLNEMRYRYIQAVFRKHGVTEAEFDSSMVYYSGYAEKLADIYKNVLARTQAEAERMGLAAETTHDQFSGLTDQGDTANIWLGKNFACLMPDERHGLYHFQRTADSTFLAGDAFIWRITTQEVSRSMMQDAYVQFIVRYADTVAVVNESLRGSTMHDISYNPIEKLDTMPIRSVMGLVYLPKNDYKDAGQQVLLLSKMALIRIHHEKVETTPADSLVTDSLSADSIEVDSVIQGPSENVRKTPLQMRESQPKEHRINVVKENPNPIRPQKGYRNNSRRKLSR